MPLEDVRKVADADFPTRWGHFRILGFEGTRIDPEPCQPGTPSVPKKVEGAVALVLGDIHDGPPVVRIHSQCLTGDVFGSLRCDCGAQLDAAMAAIAAEGRGVGLYLRGHEGRGVGLLSKLQAYELQDAGADTVDANTELGLPVDAREYSAGAQMLADLGVGSVRLLTNNPAKVTGLADCGVDITARIPLASAVTPFNLRYLTTKRDRLGHQIQELEDSERAGARAPASHRAESA